MHRKLIAVILTGLLLAGCVQIPKAPVTNAPTTESTEPSVSADLTESTASDTSKTTENPTETTAAPTETTEVTETTVEDTTAPTDPTDETEPAHSDLFISYVSADEMVQYFSEVVLDAEFVNSGDATVLQRWETPICYYVHGDYTPEDILKIEELAAWLNTVEGFPGMEEADVPGVANLSIYFCSQQELIDRMGDNHYNSDGAVTFWYDGQNAIYTATICIRSDLDQALRNSVILEEIYNGLGPIQDTDLRQESIIYSGFSQPQALHPIDRVILQLLYHPSLSCGMNLAECEAAIHALYY